MHLLLSAFSFLTILPWRGGPMPPQRLPAVGVFFPVVGWCLGAGLAASGWLLMTIGLAPLPAAALLVAGEAWVTRGLHLDGVADLLDGFGGGFEPARRLAIMKDSTIGSFGVVGLVLVLLMKTAGLAVLLPILTTEGGPERCFSFLCLAFVPAVARFSILLLSWKSCYPRAHGTGHAFVGKFRGRHVLLGLCFLAPILLAAGIDPRRLLTVLACLGAGLLPSCILRRQGHRLLGGITGDVLGAGCEFGEATGWLVLSLIL